MIVKLMKLLKEKKGAMPLFYIYIALGIIVTSLIISEVMRFHNIDEHLNDELNRAVNLAIKEAMFDSWRVDSVSKFDEAVARNSFYDYLFYEMVLDSNLRKFSDGKRVYTIMIEELNVDGNSVRMNVKATALIPSLFGFGEDFKDQINVTSRNMRVDDR